MPQFTIGKLFHLEMVITGIATNTLIMAINLLWSTMPLVRYLKVTGRYQQKRFGRLWTMPGIIRSIGDPMEIGPLPKFKEKESTEFR